MRLVDADTLRERLDGRYFDITGVPATAELDAAPSIAVSCPKCGEVVIDDQPHGA